MFNPNPDSIQVNFKVHCDCKCTMRCVGGNPLSEEPLYLAHRSKKTILPVISVNGTFKGTATTFGGEGAYERLKHDNIHPHTFISTVCSQFLQPARPSGGR